MLRELKRLITRGNEAAVEHWKRSMKVKKGL